MRYKKGEKEAMRKAGFPWCYCVKGEERHCNSCIENHRAFDDGYAKAKSDALSLLNKEIK